MGSFHTLYIHKFQVQEAARATEQTSIRRRAARFLTIDEQLPLLCHLVAMQLQHLSEIFSRLPVRLEDKSGLSGKGESKSDHSYIPKPSNWGKFHSVS